MENDKKDYSSKILSSILLLVIGFWAGTYHLQIFNTIGSALGFVRKTEELDLAQLEEAYYKISQNFDGKIDKDKLVESATKGLAEGFGDDYTEFLTAKENEDLEKSLSGDVGVGVGIEVGFRNKRPTVIRPLKDNPAILAGIKSGDVILEVNGEKVADKTIKEITDKIKGDPDTTVKLKISRAGEEKEFSIVRQKINNPSVELDFDGEVAILTVSRFDQEVGVLSKKYAQEIKSRGAKKIILDLRGNGGGYVTAAQDLASLWLDRETLILEQKSNGKTTDSTYAKGGNILKDIPTVVLGDENSASASEIVIGALKHHRAARFIGKKTFGKGSVQVNYDLKNGTSVKVTVARWFTPGGQNIDKQGIVPDQEVYLTDEDRDAGRDPQLQSAKDYLK